MNITYNKNLTKRELEVLNWVALGYSNKEIAKILGITVHTVKSHLDNISFKFNAHGRVHAINYALKNNILK